VIEVYRLHSGRYPGNSKGAAIYGGRWNRQGVEAIYTASSRSLAILEVLVHYTVVPRDFVVTPIRIPDRVPVFTLPDEEYPAGWDQPTTSAARDNPSVGKHFDTNAVLVVRSTIVPKESIYVLNPAHENFKYVQFLPSEPFQFDPRLK